MKILKKILCTTFFSVCALTSFTFAKTGKVNIEAARIRQEANTTSEIVNVIYEDNEVEILEESGDWCKIKYKDDTGYVKKEFLTIDKETQSQNQVQNQTQTSNNTNNTTSQNQTNQQVAEAQTTEQNNQQTATNVNSEVYAKLLPSFVSKDIFKVDFSKQIEKITEINNWVQITDGQNVGWIVKAKFDTTPAPQPEPPKENNNQNATNNVVNTNSVSNTVANNTNTSNTTKLENTTPSNTSSEKQTATITVETAIVREKASTSSDAIGYLDYGDKITLLEQEGEWYKINFENETGYVKNTLFKINDKSVSSRSLVEERKETEEQPEEVKQTSQASEVVEYAKQYLGYPYVVGGKTPSTGFDCSGFTRYVYLNFGYSLGSTASSQTNIGTEITRDNLEPGDLILFQNEEKTKIGHTGVYIGGGDFIHAANPQRGIVTDNLNTNSYYNERFVSARRIVN